MKKKKWTITLLIISSLLMISSLLLIYNLIKLNNIENNLRLIGGIIIVVFTFLYIMLCYKRINEYKLLKNILLLILGIIYIGITGFLNYNFQIIYSKISNVTSNYKTTTLCLVTMKTNKINDIKDIATGDIGVINDTKIPNGIKLAETIVKEEKLDNDLKKYGEYLYIIQDLYKGKIKYAFLPESYTNMFSMFDGYSDIANKTKIIYKKEKKEQVSSSNKSINEPFTILLMGVDTLQNSYNADTLLVVTFNPKTLSTTLLSIPRDTYTQIACTGGKHKINSSGWYGDSCVVDTISKYLDVDIDYYAKVNFVGIVELVDDLGGIEVDVPYSLCEQNSRRQFGDNTVYVEEGLHTLNGEQALALSRNRHEWPQYCSSKWNKDGNRSDFTRGQNQQLVLKAILNKITKIRNINTVYDLLDTLGGNIDTNMDQNTILSFYNIAKDIVIKSKNVSFDEIINIQRLYFTSYTPTVRISGLPLSMVVNYDNSVKAIQKAMKQNLGIIKKDFDLSYEFDINNPYEEKIIGKGLTGESTLETLPEFIGKDYKNVVEYANSNNLELTIEYKNITDDSFKNGIVISQTPESYTDVSTINKSKGITILVAKTKETNGEIDYTICKLKKNKDNSICKIPNFKDKPYSEYIKWKLNVNNYLIITVIEKKLESETQFDLIKSQTGPDNLYELVNGDSLNIEFYAPKPVVTTTEENEPTTLFEED